jgi:hypothetical protein
MIFMSDDRYIEIQRVIAENSDIVEFGDVGSGASSEWIAKAEEKLSVKFPPSYIWWLKNYGGGTVFGDEVYSVYELDAVVGGDIVYINELDRKNGFCKTHELSILCTDQGDHYYLDLSKVDDKQESPVYNHFTKEWYAEDFIDFLNKQITG